jgi:hypothetical protein
MRLFSPDCKPSRQLPVTGNFTFHAPGLKPPRKGLKRYKVFAGRNSAGKNLI